MRPVSKRDELQRLLREIHAIQERHQGRRMSEQTGRWFEERAQEAERLQREVDASQRAATPIGAGTRT